LSVLGGEGMEALLSAIGEKIGEGLGGSEEPVLTRARHRQGLEKCVASLDRFAEAPQLELGAEDLRLAGQAMGRLTGKVGVEDILDAIFAKFCIGK
ncbi:MAG: tRNA uridine-5-carboxymethylaminomethyl(34) synthesis GTPase MnmE, partial [Rhodospirillales bacterium]|nr:tRNA uridine-5-carboxymethylaminomethyl(34) synthesis GTPase MnmE [Rhodospirillales bacterium]